MGVFRPCDRVLLSAFDDARQVCVLSTSDSDLVGYDGRLGEGRLLLVLAAVLVALIEGSCCCAVKAKFVAALLCSRFRGTWEVDFTSE